MLILCDTRQQAGKHKNIDDYFKKTGIQSERCALYVGDYVIANDQRRAVDTKQDVLELIMDMHKDHERFAAECDRANQAHISLLVLVEEVLPKGGLTAWQSPTDKNGNPLTKTNMEAFKRSLYTMTMKYGVRFRFCDPRSTGRLLVAYLTEGALPP